METKDMIEILRLYRHDLMNDLQIVQGYLSMGKIDKVETKLSACIAHFNEERKLMSLNVPKFALWLIQFNSIHAIFRFTYHINTENKNFEGLDDALLTHCQLCIELLEEVANDTELYEGNIQLNFQSSTVDVQISMFGEFTGIEDLIIDSNHIDQEIDVHIQREVDGITCTISIPCN